MNDFKKYVPWQLKIAIKILLSKLPVPYGLWKKIGVFEHGDMNLNVRSLTVFLEHLKTADLISNTNGVNVIKKKNNEFSLLELGVGDSLFTAIVAKALGATKTWLVDAGAYANEDIKIYIQFSNQLRQLGYTNVPAINDGDKIDDILCKCNAIYLTNGIQSLNDIQTGSIDYCFSNAVLEHIPRGQFHELLHELRRIMKPDGVNVHRVDLKDHLAGSLNNLRFKESVWESDLMRNSGFYTNRIRFNEMIGYFEDAGFGISTPRIVRWDTLPTPQKKMNAEFKNLPESDLLVSGFDAVLVKK